MIVAVNYTVKMKFKTVINKISTPTELTHSPEILKDCEHLCAKKATGSNTLLNVSQPAYY